MLELMGYGCLITLLVGIAAWLGERWCAALRWPRRWIWIAAVLATFAVPVAVLVSSPARPLAVVPITARHDVDVATFIERRDALSPTVAVTSTAKHRWQLDAIVQWLWALASAALLTCFAAGYWNLWRKLHALPRACIGGVELRITDQLGPAVFGMLKPMILLPRWLLDAPATTRALVIAHERAHVRAGDPLLLTLALLLATLVPWNLPLWWQLRRLRAAIEVDCDRRVLRTGGDVTAYGEALLAVAQHRSRAPLGAMALAEPVSQLQHRFLAMTTTRSSGTRELLVACTLGSLAVAAATQIPPPATLVGFASRPVAASQPDVAIPRSARPLSLWVIPEFAPPSLPALPAVSISTAARGSTASGQVSRVDIDAWWVLANDAFQQHLDATGHGMGEYFSAVAQLDVATELQQAQARGEIISIAQPKARAAAGREVTLTAPAQLSFQQFSADDELVEQVMDVLLHLTATPRVEANEVVDLSFELGLEPVNNAFGGTLHWQKRVQRGEALLVKWMRNEPMLGPSPKQGDKNQLYVFIKPRVVASGR